MLFATSITNNCTFHDDRFIEIITEKKVSFINETCSGSRLQNMLPTTGKSQFMKMENFMEFIRAELISIFSIYENEKLRGIHTSHPIYFGGKKNII